MAYKEKQIINDVLLKGSKHGRLFRANSGMAWIGKILKKAKDFIIIKNPRPFHGMPEGTPDCIGWESKEIAISCCGSCKMYTKESCPEYSTDHQKCCICYIPFNAQKIAIFKGVEIKTGNLQLTPEQKRFKKILLEHGGIYEEQRENRKNV